MKKGKLIVFDGNDGSGKQTQVEYLVSRLEDEGHKVRTIDFPRYYDNFFGRFIGRCLTGDYGDFLNIDPHIISTLYAADRLESTPTIKKWIDNGYIVITDRYVSANQIHQGGKIENVTDRRNFMKWLDDMEYKTFGLVKPHAVIYLDVPVEVSLKNVKTKKNKTYMEGKTDIAETDKKYLRNSRACAQWLSEQNSDWHRVDCMQGSKMRSIEDIHEEIYKIVKKLI